MRESNFAFPAQNRACVCISSQLYDRRALDTTSPLPLFNSLTHLTYLTSTSPRIREILTMDGGLERLVRLLRDFCAHPPPPDPPALFYGLTPPSSSSTSSTSSSSSSSTAATTTATPDPKRPFDRAAAYRFSLAFQCVVNIGVRGSEPIRARVVQAGTLDVVGCVLEAWLASRGFAVIPSQSASGMPRETREARHARRLEARARETTTTSTTTILAVDEDMLDTSNDTSPSSTPRRSPTPTATRERSSTLRPAISAQPSTSSAARTDTEPESDPDADMLDASSASASASPAPQQQPQPRRTVGIVGDDAPAPLDVDMGLDMLLATDRFVTLDPAAAAAAAATEPREQEDRTPRAAFARLPPSDPPVQPPAPQTQPVHNSAAHAHHHHHHHDAGPYREEDVLLSLQLLAYLSKYPHVRQAFYKPRASFNPALHPPVIPPPPAHKDPPTGFFKALAGATVGRKDRDRDRDRHSLPRPSAPSIHAPTAPSPALTHSPNVFSLVERFTFRPSPPEAATHNLPPLPAEIQYWAGVIMRNACRKDEARGGVRQCANMRCGRWESFPREFAKCRRCRKAKYCGKECQSRAWAEGHRFWCSAREEEGAAAAAAAAGGSGAGAGVDGGDAAVAVAAAAAAVVGVSRPRGDRIRVAGAAAGPGAAGPGPGPGRTMTILYGAGGEQSVYTRPRVNALAPQQTHPALATWTAPLAHAASPILPPPPPVHPSQSQSRMTQSLPLSQGHAPYLHMGPGGPSVSTADLPGTADGGGGGAGRERVRDDVERRRRRGAGAGAGAGVDDMVLG